MNTVNQILARKGFVAIAVVAGTTVLKALEIMEEKNIGSVVVLHPDGTFEGIVTERDYSRKIILKGKSSTDTKVEEIMSTDLPHVTVKDTVEHCMELMSGNNIRYLPVLAGGELRGIVSMSDVVKETILMPGKLPLQHSTHP